MNHGLTHGRLIRGALTGAALASVLFLGVVGGIHVHADHAGDECPICLQLDHLGLEAPQITFEVVTSAAPLDTHDHLPEIHGLLLPGNDPARAPPSAS